MTHPGLEPYDPLSRAARGHALEKLAPTAADLERGFELHRRSLVVDAFGFCPYVLPPDLAEQLHLAAATATPGVTDLLYELRQTACTRFDSCAEEYFRAFDAAGVACIVQTAGSGEGVAPTLRSLARFVSVCDHHAQRLGRAATAADIRRAHADGRRSIVLSVNGPIVGLDNDPAGGDLHWLRTFAQLGVRFMHLAYNIRNRVGDGCVEVDDRGLTDFGAQVVAEMQRLGIVVDLSHTGLRTGMDAVRRATRPVVATHTACRALNPHDRCKTDEAIRAIAGTGGFIGIAAIPPFLGRGGDITALLDHIDHAVQLVGADHVAIGTDINASPELPEEARRLIEKRVENPPASGGPAGGVFPPPGGGGLSIRWKPDDPIHRPGVFDECRRSLAWTNWPLYTVGLVQRGYSDGDIQKIIGGNVLRVMDSACNERPAPPLAKEAS